MYGWSGLFNASTVMNDQPRVIDFKPVTSVVLKCVVRKAQTGEPPQDYFCFVLQVRRKNYSIEYFYHFTKFVYVE
jgi:hypothetical protein